MTFYVFYDSKQINDLIKGKQMELFTLKNGIVNLFILIMICLLLF